jgi:hypothetical protein
VIAFDESIGRAGMHRKLFGFDRDLCGQRVDGQMRGFTNRQRATRLTDFVPHAMLLFSVSLIGCGIVKPPLFLALETEHFEIYREEGLPAACEATGEQFKGYLLVFENYLGVHLPVGQKIIYNQLKTYAYVAELCDLDPSQGSSGCYNPQGDVIASVYSVHPHEIAHVLEHRIGGFGAHTLFFSEGIASMLGGDNSYDTPDHRVDSTLPVEALVDDGAFVASYRKPLGMGGGGGALYSTAAGFVRYLIDTYAKDAFLRFYASLEGVTSGAVVKQRLTAAFGAPFDDIVAAWRAGVQPLVADLPPTMPACDQPSALALGATATVDPQCESARLRFDVPSSGRIDLFLSPTGSYPSVALWSCANGSVNPEELLLLNGPMRIALDVPPGPYEVAVHGSPVDVSNETTPVTIGLDGACDAAPVPAVVGAAPFADFGLIRRWGSTEKSVAFDVISQSVGGLNAASIGGELPGTAPDLLYLCPEGCVADLDGQCIADDFVVHQLPDGTFDDTHNVLGSPVTVGDLLHFATGPRYWQDWGYSIRLSIH